MNKQAFLDGYLAKIKDAAKHWKKQSFSKSPDLGSKDTDQAWSEHYLDLVNKHRSVFDNPKDDLSKLMNKLKLFPKDYTTHYNMKD